MKLTCVGCGRHFGYTKAKTLDERLISHKRDLVPPTVSAELAPLWLKVARSEPGKDAVCPDCVAKIGDGIGTIHVKKGTIAGIVGIRPLVEFRSPKEQSVEKPKTVPFELKPGSAYPPAVQIAMAIKEGKHPKFARFDRRKGTLTPCIVSFNVPSACDRSEDWRTMRTLQSPKDPRAFFAFCDTCREIVSKCLNGSTQFGVTLFEAITGKKPEERREEPPPPDDNIVRFPVEPVAEVVPIERARERRGWTRQSARRFDSVSSVRESVITRAVCNVAPQIVGDPNERLVDVPVFYPSGFETVDLCFDALSQTATRYDDLVQMHADGKIRKGSPEWETAKAEAKACLLHGPEAKALGQFRASVIQQIQRNWPEEWTTRGKSERTGTLRCSKGGEYVRMLFDPDTYMPLAPDSDRIGVGLCGGCKDRVKNVRTRVARAQKKTRAGQGLGVKRRKK